MGDQESQTDSRGMIGQHPIRHKRQMYDLLVKGAFGNTVPQWFSLESWLGSEERNRYSIWGIRSLTPGGPCRLYCPVEEVARTVEEFRCRGHEVNISLMIDPICRVTLMADIYDSDTGLLVYGVENPPKGSNWRKIMPTEGREYRGVEARMLLRRHLNGSSLSDLEVLWEQYPGHVVELSNCDRCLGTVPGRNAVVWEVRKY